MLLKAAIFDLDGTVLSNEDEYGEAFRRVLKGVGKKVDSKYPHVSGVGVEENWPILIDRYKINTKKKVLELARETQEAYLSLLPRIEFKPGFEVFVKQLKKSGVMCALATSNVYYIVEIIIDEFKLDKYFDCITTGEEVSFKKPNPDIFLKTLEKLSVENDSCLVFEDSQVGVEAAHAAGLKVIALSRSSKHKRVLKEADGVVESFKQVTPKMIESL